MPTGRQMLEHLKSTNYIKIENLTQDQVCMRLVGLFLRSMSKENGWKTKTNLIPSHAIKTDSLIFQMRTRQPNPNHPKNLPSQLNNPHLKL